MRSRGFNDEDALLRGLRQLYFGRVALRADERLGAPPEVQSDRSIWRLPQEIAVRELMLMKETLVIEKKAPKKLRNGILVTGLPGIGLIGQVVGRYLVEELKAEKIANVIS